MDKDTAIKKIRKCLALAKSNNPHESAAALRQAQKLMEEFNLEHPDLLAADVAEHFAKSNCAKSPPNYEVFLADTIAKAFACELLFSHRCNVKTFKFEGIYKFVGMSASAEVASYTYSVLRRQLAKARAEYIKTGLKRYKNKTAPADIFCEAWIVSVRQKIINMAATDEQTNAIGRYMDIHHSSLVKRKTRETKAARNSQNHALNGHLQGKSVVLNKGVNAAGADNKQKMLGQS